MARRFPSAGGLEVSVPSRTIISFSLVSATELLHDAGDVVGLHRLAVAPVDGDDRTPAAAAGALDGAERELAVVGRLARLDPELLLEGLDDLLRPDERARHVRTNPDRVLTGRLGLVPVVERRDRHAVRGGQVERLGHLAVGLGREPAVALLGEAQRRQHRRARLGVLRRDLANLVVERLRAHLSTSPMTPSSDPTTAIMSAISSSRRSVGASAVAANDGARKCTRHGFAPPSLTT